MAIAGPAAITRWTWRAAGTMPVILANTSSMAAFPCGRLLNLYERFPAAFPDGTLNIPENSNGVPDILDEARWEMEFLLAMQVPKVSHRREWFITSTRSQLGTGADDAAQ